MTQPFFTIIIPVKAINDYIRETVTHILKFQDADWELIILPNDHTSSEWNDPRIKIVASGPIGPGKKRDLGAQKATGVVLVFLDDDSYPEHNLLTVARPYFSNQEIAALGGPAVTPPEDSFWQKVSGAVFLSRFSGGSPERYVPIGDVREVDDWPSVNLMVRTSDFLDVGGFDSLYWPGEDTKLCLKLIRKGKKILYDPKLIVWHHRRPGLKSHLKQVGAYGLHRGYFAKRYPETSFKINYFAPSFLLLFVLATLIGFLIGVTPFIKYVLLGVWGLYGLALIKALTDFISHVPFTIALTSLGYTVMTHLVYGSQFIRGFIFTRNLVSRLR